MKILLYGLNFAPELLGVGKYTGEFAEWLVSHGHEVIVVTAPPYYPHWKVQQGYSSFRYTKHIERNTLIFRCPIWVPHEPSAMKRIFHLISFAVSSFPVVIWKALQFRPLLVMVFAPTIVCAPGGLVAAWLSKAKSWLHFQDLEIDAAFGISLLQGGFLRTMVKKSERRILGRYDRISSISEQMNRRLISKGCNPDKNLLFPNWVDTTSIYPIEEMRKLRAEFHLPEESFLVLYSGNLGAKQGLDILIETARTLTDHPKIHFVVAGDGVYRDTLLRLASGMTNITFIPLQPADRFNAFLNTADVHIVSQLSGIADAVMPSKLLGILAAGGAVVAIVQEGTGLASVIGEAGGIAIPPGDPQGLSDILKTLCGSHERLTEMRRHAREYAVRNIDKVKILEAIEVQILQFSNN